MSEIDRINYLIDTLAGGNARRFAEACEIRPDCLSRIRNGKGVPSFYFPRIMHGYPDVQKDWLYTGEGKPLKSTAEKDVLAAKLDTLTAEVRELSELLRKALKRL
jgi:hypothetical protein